MTIRSIATLCAALVLSAHPGAAVQAEPAGHINGVGGIFIKAKDPKALAAWYHDVLGLPVQSWGGAKFSNDAPDHPPALAWSVFPDTTKYFAPSTGDFMIDYAVDDLDAFLKRLGEKGVAPLKRVDDDTSGRFAWIVDPEGNKVELWEPKRTPAPAK